MQHCLHPDRLAGLPCPAPPTASNPPLPLCAAAPCTPLHTPPLPHACLPPTAPATLPPCCSKPGLTAQAESAISAKATVIPPAAGRPWKAYVLTLCVKAATTKSVTNCTTLEPCTAAADANAATVCPLPGTKAEVTYSVTAKAIRAADNAESAASDPAEFTSPKYPCVPPRCCRQGLRRCALEGVAAAATDLPLSMHSAHVQPPARLAAPPQQAGCRCQAHRPLHCQRDGHPARVWGALAQVQAHILRRQHHQLQDGGLRAGDRATRPHQLPSDRPEPQHQLYRGGCGSEPRRQREPAQRPRHVHHWRLQVGLLGAAGIVALLRWCPCCIPARTRPASSSPTLPCPHTLPGCPPLPHPCRLAASLSWRPSL